MIELHYYLKSHSYPGRGLILGISQNGEKAVAAYFITGRSKDSQNRIFVAEGREVHISTLGGNVNNPSLIIYSPVRVCGNILIVTNGDQTDTICSYIRNGHRFEDALRTRSFEPDPPIYTPRISGVMNLADGGYMISILKKDPASPSRCIRAFYDYEPLVPGVGHFISTYIDNGDPLPVFSDEPYTVEIFDDIDDMSVCIWDSLNEQFKVSLFVRYIDLKTKEYETRVFNKYQQEL